MTGQQNFDADSGDTGETGETGAAATGASAVAASPEAAEAIRKEALDLGWADREHWRGRQEDFIEAEEFVRMANRHLPIVNSRLKNVTSQFEKAQADWAKRDAESAARVAGLERKQKEFEEHRLAQEAEMDRQLRAQSAAHAKLMEMQRKELLESMEIEKRKVLMIEDPAQRAAAYDAVTQREQAQIRNLMEAEKVDLPPAAPVQQPARTPPPASPAYAPEAQTRANAWLERNVWLRDNPELMRIAGQIEIPPLPTLDFNANPEGHLDYIKGKMKSWGIAIPGDANPDASDSQANSAPAATTTHSSPPPVPAAAPRGSPVEGASRRGAPAASKERGYKELPPQAKAACEDLYKRGRFKGSVEEARKGYAVEYWAEYGDE